MHCRHRTALPAVSMTMRLGLVAVACLYSVALGAAELAKIEVRHKQGIYHLRLEMIMDAPVKAVRHVITDYTHIYRLNPAIVESEVMAPPATGVVRVRTLVNDCVWIFCRDILRVEDVRELETGDIHSTVVPGLSNIKSGTAIWQIQPLGQRTRIYYTMFLEPGFAVPPLIGSYVIKKKLRQEIRITLENIERIATIRDRQTGGAESTRPERPFTRVSGEHERAD